MRTKAFLDIAGAALRDKGVVFFLGRLANYLTGFGAWQYYKRFPPVKEFRFRGRTYRYFYSLYNVTWRNERAVEIPIAAAAVKEQQSGRTLEVGNVLSWYFPVQHTVLDKYEVADGIINGDIVDFNPPDRYDLIVAISTLEHVGWDESPRQPEKILRAVDHLRSLLAPGGKLIVTMPLGYNTALDRYLRSGELRFTEQRFLKRGHGNPEWFEVDEGQALEAVAHRTHKRSAFIIIGMDEKQRGAGRAASGRRDTTRAPRTV